MDAIVNRYYISAVILLLFSIACVLIATVTYDNLNTELADGLRSQFVLDSASAGAYNSWADSDDPDAGVVYSTYYVYNVTNVDEILAGGKPHVEEIGPLLYIYHNKKYNVTWDAETDNDIVEFKEWQYYTPVDNATIALAATPIVSVNLPLLGVLTNGITASIVASTAQLAAYTDPKALFITRPAGEWIFGWQNDTFLTDFNKYKNNGLVPTVPTSFPGIQGNDSSLEYALNTHSTIRMYTGRHSMDKMMEYQQWNGFNTMQCCLFGPCGDATSGRQYGNAIQPWGSADANAVAGAQGAQFHISVSCDDVLRVATYDFGMYSHWNLQCAGNSGPASTYTVQSIDMLRFQLPANTLANITVDPVMGRAYNTYGPSGLRNQSNCESGAPIYLSKPRFLDGDPSLAAALQDFPAPDRAIHDTYLGVEPITGSTLDFHWRVAVNVHLQNITTIGNFFQEFTFFPGVTPVFLPIAWGGQDSTVSSSQASKFKNSIYLARDVILGLRWGGTGLAGLLGIIAVSLAIAAECRRRRLSKADGPGIGRLIGGDSSVTAGYEAYAFTSSVNADYSRMA